MPQYLLSKPAYLNDRYYVAGSTIEWDGPPNAAMEAVDEDGETRIKAHRERAKARQHVATEVPQPGGDPPDPTWAPDPKPAFSVKTTRKPDSEKPKGEAKSTDKQASVTRNAASPK